MRAVHYFPRYSQRENVVTNNALLLLLRLHEFSRLKFEDFIEKMCAENNVEFAPQWLRFGQQVGTGISVVDGFIAQESVKVAIETKMVGSFSPNQLERHLGVFSGEQHKLLILLSPSLDEAATVQLGSAQELAKQKGIHLLHTSFQEVIRRIREQLSEHDEEMIVLVDDFEDFCSDTGLLPNDEYLLFAPPCGPSFIDNEQFRLYYCPAERSRRKAKYLGIYAGKQIRSIGRISKVVTCSIDETKGSVTVVDQAIALDDDEKMRILGATLKAPSHGWNITSGHKFYMFDEWATTSFSKVSHGGIMGHRYFDLREVLGPEFQASTSKIAELLRGRTWT